MPGWVAVLLVACLGLHLAWQLQRPPGAPAAADMPPPPRAEALRLASFGEPATMARLAMLYVQSIDFAGGQAIPYRNLDYRRLEGWLGAILELDPLSDYPLFSAARVYAEVPDEARARAMCEFVYRAFLEDPNRRWPWLAHVALLAKHRLQDLALARRYAAAVQRHATAENVPLWAKQMEIFILEDMNELEAAKIMIGGLLASGALSDPAEVRFLAERLGQLEARLSAGRR